MSTAIPANTAIQSTANQDAFATGVKIVRVDSASIAQDLGIAPGDYLVSLNGHPINDVIDYWFHGASERLKIQWRKGAADGPAQMRTIRKAFHQRLGFEVEPFEIRRCTNYCVFCFVHQLPTGMRRELYIKDEDYRLSFLYGNYITGTNLSPADKERIAKLKLSPLYISVHATDQDVRERLLAKKNIEPIVPLMKSLTDQGIFLHAQVVLCPGINDGKVLEKTVADLAELYPKVESIAVVPLGLTNHRQRLPELESVTPEYARDFLQHCARIQKKTAKRIGYPFVFPSDEFFLIAGIDPPAYDDFPEIPQLANGVGMYYRLYDGLEEQCSELPATLESPRRVAAITTHMGAKVLQRLTDEINSHIGNLHVDLLPTTNSLFGEGITVSGLLPGMDFERVIRENPGYDRYLIPENALRPWDLRFLDDMLLDELRASTAAEVMTGADTAESFISAVLDPFRN